MSKILQHNVWSVLIISLIISISYTPGYSSSAVQLEKEVVIDSPAIGTANLPDKMTFRLYDSRTAAAPIASQSFYRGGYSAYYNIAKSDGLTQKSLVRLSVEFTDLSQLGSNVEALSNLWLEVEIDGRSAGEREPLNKEATKQILSLATAQDTGGPDALQNVTKQVSGSDGQIQYNNGGVEAGASQFYYDDINHRVGIGTNNPSYGRLQVSGGQIRLDNTQPVQWYTSGGGHGWKSYAGSDDKFYIHNGGQDIARFDNSSRSLSIGGIYVSTAAPADGLIVQGNVGIGTTSPCSDCKLAVNGKIRAKSVVVDTGWSDFVFRDSYSLMPLQEVEKFIKENRHLPGIPTEADVKKNGVSVGDISAKLLQKIEELTLYVIELKKENEALQKQLGNRDRLSP